jgi:hypothetical protein
MHQLRKHQQSNRIKKKPLNNSNVERSSGFTLLLDRNNFLASLETKIYPILVSFYLCALTIAVRDQQVQKAKFA